jgi:hypothetical protein
MQIEMLLFFILFLLSCSSCQIAQRSSLLSEQGSPSKDTVIDKYIEGLQKGDEAAIENLIPEGLDAKKGIAEKLKLYKNHTIEVQKICYEFGDKTSIVDTVIYGDLIVNATGKKKNFTEKIKLLGQAKGWFLGLGSPKPSIPKNMGPTTAPETKIK